MTQDLSGLNEFSIHAMEWKGVTLTPASASQIKVLTRGSTWFRLDVRPSGCTGFAYNVTLIEAPSEEDIPFESQGLTIFVALKALPMVDGTEIDYVREGLNQSLVYHNPNVKNMCGCGESFGV